MAVTGRAALVALIGTLAAVLLRTVAGLLVVDGLIAAVIVADIARAGSVRRLEISRSGDTRIMLGEAGATTLKRSQCAQSGRWGSGRARPTSQRRGEYVCCPRS
jgi:hypothetical protein